MLDEMDGSPAKVFGLAAVQKRVINKIAVLDLANASFLHGFCIHVWVRFTDERLLGVIAECQPVKQVLDTQQTDDSLGVGNIGVGEEPCFDFGPVDIIKQPPESRIRLDDVLERQSIVDFGVVL